MSDNSSDHILQVVRAAVANKTSLNIIGGNSKNFYGNLSKGEALNTSDHRGIVSYEPTELVVTARCGTRLTDLELLLSEQQQMLPFEPPHFADTATVGGMTACGLSGPRRPYAGSVRDYVLGVRCINGKGEDLTFGGQVMKNVAGFDASRLMTGALGTLGVILEVSFKLLPKPEDEMTLQLEVDQQQAIEIMNRWAGQAVPLSAACYEECIDKKTGNKNTGRLLFRLSGYSAALQAAHKKIGGEIIPDADDFWRDLNEHKNEFFAGNDNKPLWRLAVPSATSPLGLEGETIIDWGGAQRWLRSEQSAEQIREQVNKQGGHATLFRSGHKSTGNIEAFSPLSPALLTLHKRLKNAYDPGGIFNPGRMYSDL
jgi:glycolate oxidase FAD binding subunit